MKYFAIAPIKHLDLIKNEKHHMVITPFLKDKKVMDFYREQKETGAKIMMDNGEFEDKAITLDEYIDFVIALRPNIICLPDAWKHPEETINKHAKALKKLREIGITPKCMIIPHGNNLLEYFGCTAHIVNNVIGEYLKVGYEFIMGLTFAEWGDTSGMIRPFLSHCMMSFPGEFHFLGLYNTKELWTCSDKVVSVDSSFPFKAALEGTLLRSTNGTVITKSFDFHASLTDKQIELAKLNLKIMHWLVEERGKENPFELMR